MEQGCIFKKIFYALILVRDSLLIVQVEKTIDANDNKNGRRFIFD